MVKGKSFILAFALCASLYPAILNAEPGDAFKVKGADTLSLKGADTLSVKGVDTLSVQPVDSTKKKKLQKRVLMHKGEFAVGAFFMYANLNSANSEFFLLVNNLSASGSFFRIAPQVVWAYHDNCSVGVRFIYMKLTGDVDSGNIGLLNPDLTITIPKVGINYQNYKAAVFHRNYIGLDRKGTVGLYLDSQLAYAYSRLDFRTEKMGNYNTGNQIVLSFSPGVLLYILPMVSVELSFSILDIGYTHTKAFREEQYVGCKESWNAAAKFNLFGLNFGINYHF